MNMREVERGVWLFSDTYDDEHVMDRLHDALESWESGQSTVAERKLLKLLATHPSHIDALHHLSLIYMESGRKTEAHVFNLAAVGTGMAAIPSVFSWQKARLEWSFLSNRPFLRAYHSLGLWYLDHEQYDDAIEVFSRLLAISPNDNLGVRYLLPECWLAQGMPDLVLKHCSAHKNDSGPDILYSRALALVLSDKMDSAKKALEEAVASMPLVAKELLKKTHRRPVSNFPGTISWGGTDQAYEHWRRYGKYWASSSKAMQLLTIVSRGN